MFLPYPFPITRKADWAIPKNPHPHDGRHAGKSHGRWRLTAVEIQMRGGGALNLKIHPQGLLLISFMFELLQWVRFQKNALHFQILLFFQTTDLLPHLF